MNRKDSSLRAAEFSFPGAAIALHFTLSVHVRILLHQNQFAV
jgi:hypothetical protein